MRHSINELKKIISDFSDEDFGEPLPCTKCEYVPTVIPPKVHPRIGFTAARLEQLKQDVHHPENKYAWELIMSASDIDFDGVPTDVENREVINNIRVKSGEFHFIILSKALRYAITGDELYGYEAILAIKNLLRLCDRDFGVSYAEKYHISLTMAKLLLTSAYVYDWCYSLLTERDMRHIVTAATGKASQGLEYKAFPPKRGGGVCGHQSGSPYLQGWFSFTLATCDEYPEYYNHIADLLFNTIVPGQNYCISGGANMQGVAYGSARMQIMMCAECYFSGMFDGKRHLFNEQMENAALDFIHCIRPDGQSMRIGDDFNQGTRYGSIVTNAFFGAWIYKNEQLKGFAKEKLQDFSIFHLSEITPIEVILYNDVRLKAVAPKLPLASYIPHPIGRMLVRTKDTGIDAGTVYMKIGEAYSTNHEHKDAGDFQIYYDGPLVTSSGAYLGYGCDHDLGYYKQTISKNCPLIFNPNMKDNGKWIYSGGQKISEENCREPQTLEAWQASDTFRRAKVLHHGYKVDGGYRYSYLCGDLTNAYDSETVTEVKRFFFNLMTDNPAQPMIHIIFDRISSVDENYKKTLLMHTLSKPVIEERDGRVYAAITNLRRRLIVQSLLCDTSYSFVGTEDNRCPVNGRAIPTPPRDYPEGIKVRHNAEVGLGRLEITPKSPAKTDLFLTVCYIDPDTDYSPFSGLNVSLVNPLRVAQELSGEAYVGAQIMGNAIVFPRDAQCLDSALEIKLTGEIKACYIVGIADKQWQVTGAEVISIGGGIAELKPTSSRITLR